MWYQVYAHAWDEHQPGLQVTTVETFRTLAISRSTVEDRRHRFVPQCRYRHSNLPFQRPALPY